MQSFCRQGHPEYLFGLVETMGMVIERDVAAWMTQQGGWVTKLESKLIFIIIYDILDCLVDAVSTTR